MRVMLASDDCNFEVDFAFAVDLDCVCVQTIQNHVGMIIK